MVLIIGYGNELMGNDGFGVYTLTLLRSLLKGDEIEFIESHQLTPEMALLISKASEVIFIDASFGEDEFVIATPLPKNISNLTTLHNLTPTSLLYICENLYGIAPKYSIFSVMFNKFFLSKTLSYRAEEIAKEMALFIQMELNNRYRTNL
jgi:hydrogenase maturation protease